MQMIQKFSLSVQKLLNQKLQTESYFLTNDPNFQHFTFSILSSHFRHFARPDFAYSISYSLFELAETPSTSSFEAAFPPPGIFSLILS